MARTARRPSAAAKAPAPIDPDAAPRSAFVLDEAYAATSGSWHKHRRAQLVHAAEGVLVVTTPTGRRIAPP